MRLRVTARLDDWMVGACFEERTDGDLDLDLSFSWSRSWSAPDDWRFCARASWIWLRMSEMIEDGAMALSSSAAVRLRFPSVACALASAPKEILLSDDRTSSSSSKLLSSSLLWLASLATDCCYMRISKPEFVYEATLDSTWISI